MADDKTTLHAGWMPSSPSMNQGGDLAAPIEGGVSTDGPVKHAGDIRDNSGTSDSGDSVGAHIMEGDYDSLFPGSGQGNLEPTGSGKAKGS